MSEGDVHFRIYEHLFPRGLAFRFNVLEKRFREFVDALSSVGRDAEEYVNGVYADLDPQTTTKLEEWEEQWNLPPVSGSTEQGRRDRLEATWKQLGGQDPRYIEDMLRNAGFDVYVHEWWELEGDGSRTEPPVVRNPNIYLQNAGTAWGVTCGADLAECGEATALDGEFTFVPSRPLVNIVFTAQTRYTTTCGNPTSQCGEAVADDGQEQNVYTRKQYDVPTDDRWWPYFLYIGGETFPQIAEVPIERRDEFEELLLSICPCHLLIGPIVSYV